MFTLKELKRNLKKDTSTLPEIRVAVVGDSATQLLSVALQGIAIERGYRLLLWEADYSQVERQFFDPNSELHQFDAQYIVVFQSTHKLQEAYCRSGLKQTSIANDRLALVRQMAATTKSCIIYLNYSEIDDCVFGSYANSVPSSFLYQVRKLNFDLMNLSVEVPNLFVCDISSLQNKYGRDWLFDSSIYMSTEIVLSVEATPYVASRVMDIVCAMGGKFKKCLILDLDNTLWGGVIGDDGIENIQLGHGLGIGKAFTEFQQWIKKLKNRGIIICVCSKNNEDTAKEPFLHHPEMVLRLEDVAVFKANWDTKADNIRTIQRILNIGFDSMVFLDDNPFERNMVREAIPLVTVPELPEDPGDYLEYLYSLNLFETASFSSGDKDRTKQYQVEALRVDAAKTFGEESDYLKFLNMVCEVSSINKFNTPRVAQLSQRSNQFNLRTVRYSEANVTSMGQDDRYASFCFTLSDKYGDSGLIAVVILEKKDTKVLFVDTWFMSCRVLKRGMEDFTLNVLVQYAKENGFESIVGEYLPTAKNKMVEDHYEKLGFLRVLGAETAQWILSVNEYEERECFIERKENHED